MTTNELDALVSRLQKNKAVVEAAIDKRNRAIKAAKLAEEELDNARRAFQTSRNELLWAVHGDEPNWLLP